MRTGTQFSGQSPGNLSQGVGSANETTEREVDRVRVIVIGAGAAGLATAACLLRRGIRPVVLDRGESVGRTGRALAGCACTPPASSHTCRATDCPRRPDGGFPETTWSDTSRPTRRTTGSKSGSA